MLQRVQRVPTRPGAVPEVRNRIQPAPDAALALSALDQPERRVWLGLANPLLLTASTVVIAKTGLLLGWRRSSAVLAALCSRLLTMVPLYNAEFFAEPGVTFGTSLLMLGFVIWPRRLGRGALLVGIGTGVAILFRPDSLFVVGAMVPFLLLFHGREALVRDLARLVSPARGTDRARRRLDSLVRLPALRRSVQVRLQRRLRRGGILDAAVPRVAELVWSPGKSFFLYCPILLAAIPGIVLLARRRPRLTVVVVAMFVVRASRLAVVHARGWELVGPAVPAPAVRGSRDTTR